MTDYKASKRIVGTSAERTAVTPSSDPVADTSTSSGNTILKFTATGSYTFTPSCFYLFQFYFNFY